MKVIQLAPSAYAFEPDSPVERIAAITEDRLRSYGLDDRAIRSFMQFRARPLEAAPDSDSNPETAPPSA